MYGYIKTHVPELKMREMEYYKAVYCGLCRTMGQCTGQCSRLTLSYDFTFFALVRMAIEGYNPTIEKRVCLVHPLKKRLMAEPNPTLEMCAYLSGIMAYHKVLDDRHDEGGHRRFKAGVAMPYVSGLRKKALRHGYGQADDHVAQCMKELAELEAEQPMSADRPAELFGNLMSYLLAYGLEENTQKIAQNIGKHIGRWVYLMDAIDDFEEDKKKGRYNPFLCLWQHEDMTSNRRQTLESALTAELVAVENALNLCDNPTEESKNLWGVVHNILYMGMPMTAKKILFPELFECQKCKGKKKKDNV